MWLLKQQDCFEFVQIRESPVQLLMQTKMPHLLWQAKAAAVRFATILFEETKHKENNPALIL